MNNSPSKGTALITGAYAAILCGVAFLLRRVPEMQRIVQPHVWADPYGSEPVAEFATFEEAYAFADDLNKQVDA